MDSDTTAHVGRILLEPPDDSDTEKGGLDGGDALVVFVVGPTKHDNGSVLGSNAGENYEYIADCVANAAGTVSVNPGNSAIHRRLERRPWCGASDGSQPPPCDDCSDNTG